LVKTNRKARARARREISHIVKNAEFVDEKIIEFKTALQTSTDEVSECRKRILYLEAYSRRENLKFEGIPELVETTDQQNATSNEETKKVKVFYGKCPWN